MADIHRTPQDVYALVIPESPLDDEYNAGDEVIIPETDRAERLEQHGWVEETRERDGVVMAELTHTGAAILNYWRDHQVQGDILTVLERGVGEFIEDALEAATTHEDVEEWSIVEMNDGELVLEGETPNGVRIERTYNLTHQDEQHPQPA